jgi:hypothetical protein
VVDVTCDVEGGMVVPGARVVIGTAVVGAAVVGGAAVTVVEPSSGDVDVADGSPPHAATASRTTEMRAIRVLISTCHQPRRRNGRAYRMDVSGQASRIASASYSPVRVP